MLMMMIIIIITTTTTTTKDFVKSAHNTHIQKHSNTDLLLHFKAAEHKAPL